MLSLIALVYLLLGCRQNHPPTDRQMLDNFNCHASKFERIRDICTKYDRFHYPPYNRSDSTTHIISFEDQLELDSLLRRVGVTRIYNDRAEVRLLFYTWGLSIGGGYKEYIYNLNLRSDIEKYTEELALDPTIEHYIVKKITEEELYQVAQRYSVNLELYRPIIGSWYIHLSREN